MQAKYPPTIIVKFRDKEPFFHSSKNDVDDVFRDAPSLWQEIWKKKFPDIRIKKLFRLVPAEHLQALRQQAMQMDAAYRKSNPPNLFSFYVVEYPNSSDSKKILAFLDELRSWREVVEFAYLDPQTRAPSVTLDAKSQNYLKQAKGKGGIDALAAWNIEGGGGDGTNQILVDFESGWNLSHADLPVNIGSPIAGEISTDAFAIDHGTGMLGIICAQDNGFGCVGITPNLKTIKLASWWSNGEPLQRADVISAAITHLPFGGVLLIEAELGGTEFIDGHSVEGYPIETMPADLAVIQLATARGICVIAAAGNGDKEIVKNSSTESGAIFVAAAKPPVKAIINKPDSGNVVNNIYTPTRLPGSNYGDRINCYAWGQGVMTLQNDSDGYGEVGMTSAAAAIIAGAALSMQGMIHAKFNVRVDGKRLRDILSDKSLGTASKAGEQINVMPDLQKFIDALPTLQLSVHTLPVTDLYLHGFAADDGDPFNTLANQDAAFSPDIVILANGLAVPKNANGELLIQQGQAHQVRLQVWNRGVESSTQVICHFYLWKESLTNLPHLLINLGSRPVPVVAPNSQNPTPSDELEWEVNPEIGIGIYYLVGLVEKGIEDHTGLAPYHDVTAIERLLQTTPMLKLQHRVAEISNLAWHRIQIA